MGLLPILVNIISRDYSFFASEHFDLEDRVPPDPISEPNSSVMTCLIPDAAEPFPITVVPVHLEVVHD